MAGLTFPELQRVPRLELALTPTPLTEAPRLAAALGLDRLLVKRDDNTELAEELRAAGRRPYVIPGGGSNGLGALGYVRCGLELAEQLADLRVRPRYVVCAGGSCGTLSGLTLGLALAGSDAQIAAVSISN